MRGEYHFPSPSCVAALRQDRIMAKMYSKTTVPFIGVQGGTCAGRRLRAKKWRLEAGLGHRARGAIQGDCGLRRPRHRGGRRSRRELRRAPGAGRVGDPRLAAPPTIGREIWLKFATWILLALEFALAADIRCTAVALGTMFEARGHRDDPHHAQLLPGEGHRRFRPGAPNPAGNPPRGRWVRNPYWTPAI